MTMSVRATIRYNRNAVFAVAGVETMIKTIMMKEINLVLGFRDLIGL